MADLLLIEQNIAADLQKITDLKRVYAFEPQRIDDLPAATLYFDGFDQDDETTRRKRVNWRWTLRLYVPIQDAQTAQTDLKNLIMQARQQLASDPSLGGTCLYHTMASGDVFFVPDQNNPHMVAELSVVATADEPY